MTQSNPNGDLTPKSIQSLGEIKARLDDRPRFTYDIPEKLRGYGISTVTLVELSAEEELMATKRARNDPIRLAYELAKESLRMVDDQRVNTGDGSSDIVWGKMHAKVRQLVLNAYGELHSPRDEESAGFLKSRRVQVG